MSEEIKWCDIRDHLNNGHEVTIEFSCGGCCKKAKNGEVLFIGHGVIVLVAKGHSIEVITFSDGKEFTEYAKKIIITLINVCSLEFPKDHKDRRDGSIDD